MRSESRAYSPCAYPCLVVFEPMRECREAHPLRILYRSSEYGCPRLPWCGGCSCEADRCVCERVRCRPPSASAEG